MRHDNFLNLAGDIGGLPSRAHEVAAMEERLTPAERIVRGQNRGDPEMTKHAVRAVRLLMSQGAAKPTS